MNLLDSRLERTVDWTFVGFSALVVLPAKVQATTKETEVSAKGNWE